MAHTQSQRLAQAAFRAVNARAPSATRARYLSFARSFATLIHTCGLAQATAFALAKGKEQEQVLSDLAAVLRGARGYTVADGNALHQQATAAPVSEYLRVTRDALLAATWLKRYAEALLSEDTSKTPTPTGVPS